MASGNQVFEQREQITRDDDDRKDSREELERVKEYLQGVMRKNQDVEEMLLYTTQELQKERDNSRKIVQTLTERLMESREMINKLEVENMRYKKDCILAVELLQCNKSVDQARVSSTVKKLMNYTVPDPVVGHHTYPTRKSVTADDHIRPRALSKKKTNSEDSNEDTTALLAKQESNEVEMLKQNAGSSTQEKISKELEYHKGLSGNQAEQTAEETGTTLSIVDSSQPKQYEITLDMVGKEQNMEDYPKEETELLTDECQREVEDKPLIIANVLKESTDSQVDVNSVAGEAEALNNEVEGTGSCPKNETEYLNDEWSEEDKPLIADETESTTQQSRNTCEANGHMKSCKENVVNACPEKSMKSMHEQNNNVSTSASLKSTPISTQKDTIDNEHGQLLTLDEERSEEKHHSQQFSSEINIATSELASSASDNSIHLGDNIAREFVSIDGNDDDEKLPMDNSTSKESETEFKDEEKSTAITETDDETLTAEENTPLV